MKSESFSPQNLGRYTVFRVHYEYQNQPPGEKLFILLRHDKQQSQAFCWCVKATSQTKRFAANGPDIDGCVKYDAGELGFFPKETVIDPSNFITMLHSTLEKAAIEGKFCVEGKMPESFHTRFVAAVKSSQTLEPKKMKALLEAVGERF